ncbi:MAG: NAD-binding protein, partial [Rhodothermales bacterium]|nr:NAD-binding protein [Rhodothermales bacterium]
MASRKTFSLLVATALCGTAAVALAWWALDVSCAGQFTSGFSAGATCVSERLVQGANLLTLGQPEASKIVHPGLFVWARVFALAFVALGVAGIASELRDRGREWTRRVRFGWRRARGRQQTVVIGGGWVGGPLARERAQQRNAVMLLVRDPDDALVIEAGRCGAVVQTGDALSANVRRGLLLHEADEVFIATGDDRRNLDLLGRLLDEHKRHRLGHTVRYYVHLEHPTFEAQFTERLGVSKPPKYAHVAAFSVPVLAAQHLLLGPPGFPFADRPVPKDPDEKPPEPLLFDERLVEGGVGPPVVVVGLGTVGQAVVLALARFGHFPTGRRLRVTVLTLPGDDPAALLAAHPGLGATNPDGTPRRALALGGDRWADAPGDPVTHALDLAFVPVPSPDHAAVFDAALEAVRQADGPARAAVVFCVEERHSASLHTFPAVRLQERLARHFYTDGPNKDADALRTRGCPYVVVYSHLSAEGGLEELLKVGGDAVQGSRASFPLRIFGQQRAVATPEAATLATARATGEILALGYAALAQQHAPDRAATATATAFNRSNYEAALFAPTVFRTLGITFSGVRKDSLLAHPAFVRFRRALGEAAVSYTHLTLPTT